MWNNYKKFTCFTVVFVMAFILMGIFAIEVSTLVVIETQEIVWEGSCSGAELQGTTSIELTVHCASLDNFSFIIKDYPTIVEYVNSKSSILYCTKTVSNILKLTNWECHV